MRSEYLKTIPKDVLAVWEISKKMPLSSNLLEIIQTQIRQARNALKDDGSIHPDEGYECDCPSNDDGDTDHDCERPFGRELVFSFKYGDWAMLTNVCNKLREVGATVNKSCGLHVHFDCRHLSPNQVM